MKNDMINQILFKQVFLNRYKLYNYINISILANIFQIIQQSKFFASCMYLGGRKNILYRFIQGKVPDIKKIRKRQKKS